MITVIVAENSIYCKGKPGNAAVKSPSREYYGEMGPIVAKHYQGGLS